MNNAVPACSACGRVVEWGRRAYYGQWQLFTDSPETRTGGRYYRAPSGTPHLSTFHNLGSRNWHDTNHRIEVKLGENLTAKQPWYNGAPPVRLPLPVIVGSAKCLTEGEKISAKVNPIYLHDGFPAKCFSGPTCPDPIEQLTSAYDQCALQYFYAAVIDRMYANDEISIAMLFWNFVSPKFQVKFHAESGLMPAVTTLCSDVATVVVIDGTRTYQQLALQGFTSIVNPTNQGIYGTLPLWYDASTYVLDVLAADGMDSTTPIMVVGHSYGGAVAMNVVARCKHGTPSRKIRWLTYGCPKPGDQRLIDLVAQCPGASMQDSNDLVTVFPPDYLTLLPVMLALGHPEFAVWKNWVRPPNQLTLFPDGTMVPNEPPIVDYPTLLAIATRILVHLELNPISGHPIIDYLTRFRLRCPNPTWPIETPCIPEYVAATGSVGIRGQLPASGSVVHGTKTPVPPIDQRGFIVFAGKTPASGNVELRGLTPASGSVGLVSSTPASGSVGLVSWTPASGSVGLVSWTVETPNVVLTAFDMPNPIVPASGSIGLSGIVPADGCITLDKVDVPLPASGSVGLTGATITHGGAGVSGLAPTTSDVALTAPDWNHDVPWIFSPIGLVSSTPASGSVEHLGGLPPPPVPPGYGALGLVSWTPASGSVEHLGGLPPPPVPPGYGALGIGGEIASGLVGMSGDTLPRIGGSVGLTGGDGGGGGGEIVFNGIGTDEWIAPPGTTEVAVEMWGDGMGGNPGVVGEGVGGGGGGCYGIKLVPVTPGATYHAQRFQSSGTGTGIDTRFTDSGFSVLASVPGGGIWSNGTGGIGGQASAADADTAYDGGDGGNGHPDGGGGGGGSGAGPGGPGTRGSDATGTAGAAGAAGGTEAGSGGNGGSYPGGIGTAGGYPGAGQGGPAMGEPVGTDGGGPKIRLRW